MGVGGQKGGSESARRRGGGGRREEECGCAVGGLGGKQATHTHTNGIFVKTALWFRQKRTVQIKKPGRYSEQVKRSRENSG